MFKINKQSSKKKAWFMKKCVKFEHVLLSPVILNILLCTKKPPPKNADHSESTNAQTN